MVETERFIDAKAFQLTNYADALVAGTIPSTEVDLYCWDTIEEWSQFKPKVFKLSPTESAFWYLLHQITFWSPKEIGTCPELRSQVNSCVNFLRGKEDFPAFCSGIRP